jgi:hypothetical protein
MWLEKTKSPTDSTISHEDLCNQLSNYEGYTLTQFIQRSFVLTALHKNALNTVSLSHSLTTQMLTLSSSKTYVVEP